MTFILLALACSDTSQSPGSDLPTETSTSGAWSTDTFDVHPAQECSSPLAEIDYVEVGAKWGLEGDRRGAGHGI